MVIFVLKKKDKVSINLFILKIFFFQISVLKFHLNNFFGGRKTMANYICVKVHKKNEISNWFKWIADTIYESQGLEQSRW